MSSRPAEMEALAWANRKATTLFGRGSVLAKGDNPTPLGRKDWVKGDGLTPSEL